jgi:hypothetical protein
MATVEDRLDAILKEVKAIQVNQVRSATTVDELTSWSKKADVMAAELKADIQDLKSRMVALETLSTTLPKIPPREEEGWAKGHDVDKQFQGRDSGIPFPNLTPGKGEYTALRTAPYTDIPKGSGSKYSSFGPHSHQYGSKYFKLPKIDFPKFSGEHPRVWKERCEKYFSMYSVPVHMWVPFATMNFRKNATLWLQTYEAQHNIGSWAELCVAVEHKFGRDMYQNYMRDMLSIKQTSDVLEYANRFEKARHRVLVHNSEIDEVFFVQKFIDGLNYKDQQYHCFT